MNDTVDDTTDGAQALTGDALIRKALNVESERLAAALLRSQAFQELAALGGRRA